MEVNSLGICLMARLGLAPGQRYEVNGLRAIDHVFPLFTSLEGGSVDCSYGISSLISSNVTNGCSTLMNDRNEWNCAIISFKARTQ